MEEKYKKNAIRKLRNLCEKYRSILNKQKPETNTPTLKNNYVYNLFLNNDLLSKLEEEYGEFELQVLKILDELPKKSYKKKFLEAKAKQKPSFLTHPTELWDSISKRAEFFAKLDVLSEIIKDYESANVQQNELNEVAYQLSYNSVSGEIKVNDFLIHTCNVDSTIGKAINTALKKPGLILKVEKNLKSTPYSFKMPNSLRAIMFRANKDSIKIKTAVTYHDLKQTNLEKEDIDKEFNELQNR